MRLALFAFLALAATLHADDKKYWVFFGTSTGGKSTSKGIYRSEFAGGKLSEPVLAAEVTQPTFLAIHPSGKFLYCVGEVAGKKGGVHAFTLNEKTGELKKLNESDSGGNGPCHVTCDREGKCLVVANYGGGSVKCLKLEADGSIGKDSSFHQHTGSSVNPNRQKEPHAHSANVSPDNKFAIVCDLGTDKLMVYKLDAASAKLEPASPAFEEINKGSGPRHFAWHPNGKFAYTNGELDASVTALAWNAERGSFSKLALARTLPKDTPEAVLAKNSTAEVVVHPNARTLFVSNRGHDSIAVFELGADGIPSARPVSHITEGIKVPRNFNLDPSGEWIFVANQDGNSVALFKWDDVSKKAEPAGKITIDRPMCVKFVEKR